MVLTLSCDEYLLAMIGKEKNLNANNEYKI